MDFFDLSLLVERKLSSVVTTRHVQWSLKTWNFLLFCCFVSLCSGSIISLDEFLKRQRDRKEGKKVENITQWAELSRRISISIGYNMCTREWKAGAAERELLRKTVQISPHINIQHHAHAFIVLIYLTCRKLLFQLPTHDEEIQNGSVRHKTVSHSVEWNGKRAAAKNIF